MSVAAEKVIPAQNKQKVKQVVIGFDAERMKAPFLLRCGSLLIDYILLAAAPVAGILLARFMGGDGAKLLNSPISNTGWLIMILIGLTNFIIFPAFSAQSVGKMLTGLRITNLDGTSPHIGALIIRHLIGYPITLFTGCIGFVLSAFTPKGRALHDYLASTMVVYGQKSVKSKKLAKPKSVKRKKTTAKKEVGKKK